MRYNPAFDGIRAVSVLSVVAFHCNFPISNGGFIGVDVFFVLSGFLITTILREELKTADGISLGRFYYNRFLRLCPPLFMMLLVYAATAPLLFPSVNIIKDISLVGLYLSDYSRAFWGAPDYLNHTWSLSVEEHYYMIWPLVVLATRRLSNHSFFAILIVGFIFASAWRMHEITETAQWGETYFRFDTRMSGLILGSAISAISKYPRPTVATALGAVAIIILLWFASQLRWKMTTALLWGGVSVDLAAAILILSVASGQSLLARMFSWRPIVYVGLLSYSIYLWHYPIARLLRDQLDPTTTFLIVGGTSIAVAALSYEFIEKPIKAFRKRRVLAESKVLQHSGS